MNSVLRLLFVVLSPIIAIAAKDSTVWAIESGTKATTLVGVGAASKTCAIGASSQNGEIDEFNNQVICSLSYLLIRSLICSFTNSFIIVYTYSFILFPYFLLSVSSITRQRILMPEIYDGLLWKSNVVPGGIRWRDFHLWLGSYYHCTYHHGIE